VFLEGTVVASLLILYIKRAISPSEAEAKFVPMMQALAAQIEEDVLLSKRRVSDHIGSTAPNAVSQL
jgi:hypothetical protein